MEENWDGETSMPSMDINLPEPRRTHSRVRPSIGWARTLLASTGQICLCGMMRKGDYINFQREWRMRMMDGGSHP